MKSALSAPTLVNAAVNSAVATAKGAKELYDNRKEVYASAKDFAGKLTSKDDKVRDYAVGQAKAYTMSAVLGGAATKALGSRLPKPNVNVPGSSGTSFKITTPYKRPEGATTVAQRKSVQGKACVDCGELTSKQIADHKNPLVKEYYETGTIDKAKMKSIDAVQPQCPTCSVKQGVEMRKYSMEKRKELGL
nr:polymorphic toxin type 10 domain-containing protein [Leptospira kirschneri]